MLKSIIYLNNSDVKGINSVLSIFVKSLQKQWWFVCVSEKEKCRGFGTISGCSVTSFI